MHPALDLARTPSEVFKNDHHSVQHGERIMGRKHENVLIGMAINDVSTTTFIFTLTLVVIDDMIRPISSQDRANSKGSDLCCRYLLGSLTKNRHPRLGLGGADDTGRCKNAATDVAKKEELHERDGQRLASTAISAAVRFGRRTK